MPVVDTLGYPIVVEAGAIARLSVLLRDHAPAHRYAIVTDDNVAPHYLDRVRFACAEASATDRVQGVVIPPGEQHKTRERWASITDTLLAAHCGRDTVVVALGGGVVGDLAGFVAATFMRGIPVVQVPTTLLAMVDASVGGKTAVDTPAGKNTVGAFHPPSVVVIDPTTLASLPSRELRSGFAEVIKHGVIAEAGELDRVATLGEAMGRTEAIGIGALDSLIERSVRIKSSIVAGDEREHGRRKVLNFGHTIGHGIEAATQYTLLHGEAVAIGMVAESRLAERAGVAEKGTAGVVERAVSAVGLPTRLPPRSDVSRVLGLMQSDKKRRRGLLEYALPRRVGEMAGGATGWGITLPEDDVLAILSALRSLE